MIKAKHHHILSPIVLWMSRFLMKRNFTSVSIHGEFVDTAKSVLVIANHVSWWDGFWVQYLNKEVIHRKLCFMMLEDQLRKHWYFRFSGGFSVKKKSRSIFESIHYSIELLEQPKNMVLMFPQGKIHSIYQDPVKFEKGVDRIIKNVSQETQLVFVANLVDYFSDRKPNLYIYIKSLLVKDVLSSTIEVEYNTFYRQVLHTQKTKIS